MKGFQRYVAMSTLFWLPHTGKLVMAYVRFIL